MSVTQRKVTKIYIQFTNLIHFHGQPPIKNRYLFITRIFFFYGACGPIAGYGLLILEVFKITHNDTPQSISPLQGLLPDNIQHLQQTNIHAPGRIRTHNLSRRAATDLCLRPRGHWDWHTRILGAENEKNVKNIWCLPNK